MRTLILVLSLVLLLVPATLLAKTFGQGVSLSEETAVSAIIDNPEAYVGRKVKVSWNVGRQPFTYDAVIDRVGAIDDGSHELWDFAEALIDAAVAEGILAA